MSANMLRKLIFHTVKFLLLKPLVYLRMARTYRYLYNKLLKFMGVTLSGTPRFIAYSVKFDDFSKITIGDRAVISSNVILLTHDYSYTTGLIAIGRTPKTDIGIIRPIVIGNNVFIGMNSILLPGTTTGDHVIIGAGSVVGGTIAENSIVAGNPAKTVNTMDNYVERVDQKTNIDFIIDKH